MIEPAMRLIPVSGDQDICRHAALTLRNTSRSAGPVCGRGRRKVPPNLRPVDLPNLLDAPPAIAAWEGLAIPRSIRSAARDGDRLSAHTADQGRLYLLRLPRSYPQTDRQSGGVGRRVAV